MEYYIILIPALNPPKDRLASYIDDLRRRGFGKIIIVDDGSDEEYKKYFDKFKEDGIDVFTHAKNLGKGRAMKNAFNYILSSYDDFSYVICADSDGQHGVDDILKIVKNLENTEETSLVLGSRDFDRENVPPKSKFGNKLTSLIYYLFFGDRIRDTQTGLRAIPKSYLKDFLDLDGERFEYEINMLINASKTDKNIKEIPIETIYYDDNKETHFRPVMDSFKIYRVIFRTFFKFIISSISSWLVDISMFRILFNILSKTVNNYSPVIWISTFVARVISGIFNFSINKNLVFKDSSQNKGVYARYFLLWLIQLIVSAFLVDNIFKKIKIDTSVIKILVDTFIFIVSFKIQDKYIFNGSR